MRLEMIVDPSREDGRFHGHCPRPWKRLHPHVQSQSRGGYRTFCIDTSTAVLHAVVDRFLVNIQTDVVHSLHGGASLVVSESARSLSSAFLHQALLHDLFIQTIRPESAARVPPSFMVGGSGARTFGCWPKGLQCRSKTGSQMLAFEVSDLRGFLFRFIEVPFLSARHNDLFVVAAICPTAVRLPPSRGRSSGDQTQPQRWSNRAGRS